MDPQTLSYYVTHAAELARRYESVASPVARYFDVSFAAGSRVLDVGAGSGRDLAALRAAGYDAFGGWAQPVSQWRVTLGDPYRPAAKDCYAAYPVGRRQQSNSRSRTPCSRSGAHGLAPPPAAYWGTADIAGDR